MTILICGSRDWNDFKTIKSYLEDVKASHTNPNTDNTNINPLPTIIHGGCKGADSIAGYLAAQLGFPVKVFKADWQKYGKAAGPKRNQQMLDEGHPTLVVAFHDAITESKGTKDMITRAEKAGIKTIVIKSITNSSS